MVAATVEVQVVRREEREERNRVVERNGERGEEEKEKWVHILAPAICHPRPNM